ncbi:MAG: GNAT family N-acetyltransferase [Pseudomonadota bacterium]|nr:GNAT family N-acetyltransferase [Pseudomonadota bacterium]
MDIKSIAFRTDLIFSQFAGKVTDRQEYIKVETPKNPRFFYGNYLLFSAPPQNGSFVKWTELFKMEFGENKEISHMTFCWDCPAGTESDLSEFIKNEFIVEESVVLATKEIERPRKFNTEVVVRPIVTNREWDKVVENQVMSKKPEFATDEYFHFKETQFNAYREMAQAKIGNWYGAYIDGQLAGDLGLYFSDGIGRFQSVETNPFFRRQGVCSTLLYEVSRQALAEGNLQELVIVADLDYHALSVYQGVGFKPVERLKSMFWYDKKRWH